VKIVHESARAAAAAPIWRESTALFGASRAGVPTIVAAVHTRVTAMRHAPSTLHFSYAFRSALPQGSIEWEELPSLAQRVRQRSAVPTGAPWDATRPAELERPAPSQPFREPLKGVAIREVTEPDVFRHFFGR
jgi:hypothetical protein